MQENDQPRIEFYRIFIKGKSVEKLGFTQAIHPLPLNGRDNYIQVLYKQLEGISQVPFQEEPMFQSNKENFCQIVQVYPVIDELLGLNARTFTCDVSKEPQGWNDIMVKRHTFITETPLPSSIPTVKISKHELKEITKKDHYIEKFTKLRDDLAMNIQLMKSVIPPKEMIDKWKQYMNGLSPKNLINLMRKVFEKDRKEDEIFNIIYTLKKYDPSFALSPLGISIQQIPEEIMDLINDIWQLMIDAVPIIDILNYLSMDPEPDNTKAKNDFLKYRRILGVPLVA